MQRNAAPFSIAVISEEVIAAGHVVFNGRVAQVGERVEPGDELRIDGRKVQFQDWRRIRRRVLIYYKPEGEICSRNDPEQRPTVFERLPQIEMIAGWSSAHLNMTQQVFTVHEWWWIG